MKIKAVKIVSLILSVLLLFSGCANIEIHIVPGENAAQTDTTVTAAEETTVENIEVDADQDFDFDAVPAFDNTPYITINDNQPWFEEQDLSVNSFEYYGDLDELGRCTVCFANIGQDLMPTEKRGDISSVKPTGWKRYTYSFVDGGSLYNRCHLIGYQLTGENANAKNLITGTRYLNVEGMLPFEDQVASYVKSTGNHVLYRVTPLFKGDELVARGLIMEGYSVEDRGEGVCFNVYCYNNQPKVEIDYLTGESRLEDEDASTTEQSEDEVQTYILNTKSKRFHQKNCPSIEKIQSENKEKYKGTRQELIDQGYSPCGQCNP